MDGEAASRERKSGLGRFGAEGRAETNLLIRIAKTVNIGLRRVKSGTGQVSPFFRYTGERGRERWVEED